MWIHFDVAVATAVMLAVLIHWKAWDTSLKSIFAIGAMLSFHVVEEWVFPGGFHYQYNTMWKSDIPDRYPMCRLSDMITNLFATFCFVVMGIICLAAKKVYSSFVIAGVGLAVLETIIHTFLGVKMYLRFKNRGKSTIYGPGSITTYYGFIPLGVIQMFCLSEVPLSCSDWVYGVLITVLMLIIGIILPENLLKKRENAYGFQSNGYFDRFLTDSEK